MAFAVLPAAYAIRLCPAATMRQHLRPPDRRTRGQGRALRGQHRRDEIAHVVNGMVVLHAHGVAPGLRVPDILLNLGQEVRAGVAQHEPAALEQIRRAADAAEHVVVRPADVPAVSPQRLKEARSRRIDNDGRDGPPARKLPQRPLILRVRHLALLAPRVEVELLHAVPHGVLPPPQPEGCRVDRAIVARDVPLVERPLGRRRGLCRVEEVIHPALSRHPLAQHEAAVEHAGVQPRIAAADIGRQRGVVLHRKVEVQAVPLRRVADPLRVEPVVRPLGVAVEPQAASRDGAARAGLLHKAARHERHLVEQHARKRDALNEGGGAGSRVLNEALELPDLIVIDGGKGQLHSAVNSLKKLDLYGKIPILGLAKQMEEIYFPEDKDPYLLAKNSIALKTLMHIRDEAHRFGITFHRKLREKAQIKSIISEIKGIGKNTETILLQEFKTVENIKSKTIQELSALIGRKRAEIIFRYFHSSN